MYSFTFLRHLVALSKNRWRHATDRAQYSFPVFRVTPTPPFVYSMYFSAVQLSYTLQLAIITLYIQFSVTSVTSVTKSSGARSVAVTGTDDTRVALNFFMKSLGYLYCAY